MLEWSITQKNKFVGMKLEYYYRSICY